MQNFTFPQHFMFGVGDSDLQVVGEDEARKEEDSQQSMWNQFAKEKKITPPGKAIDRYHRWKEDIELLLLLGIKHYRTSISMSRTMFEDGTPNKKALNWYHNYFDSLQKNGISTYATLYQWELPQSLSAKGGWKKRQTVDAIVRHTEIVLNYLGDVIDEYFLINEPRHVSFKSYYQGLQAPGETDLAGGLQASHHVLLAQGMMTRKILDIDSAAKISTAINMAPVYPADASPKSHHAAQIAEAQMNHWFGDPLYFGKYPEIIMDIFGNKMPPIDPDDLDIMHVGDKLHAMGINYYKGVFVTEDTTSPYKFTLVKPTIGETTSIGWPIFKRPELPEGLKDICLRTYNRYKKAGLKQLYITENGTAHPSTWDGKQSVIEDQKRIEYLQEHLNQIQQLTKKGIPLTKYFLWTLMDNYEWTHGYDPNTAFGIIYVDRKTMNRIPKQSALWYQKIIANHELAR